MKNIGRAGERAGGGLLSCILRSVDKTTILYIYISLNFACVIDFSCCYVGKISSEFFSEFAIL